MVYHLQSSIIYHYAGRLSIMSTTLAERITIAREYAGLSKTELAKATGMTKQAIGQIESGDTKSPTPANLFAIARATGTNAEWIATKNGAMKMVTEPRKPYNKEVSDKERASLAAWITMHDSMTEAQRAHMRALYDSLTKPDESPDCPDGKHCHHGKAG